MNSKHKFSVNNNELLNLVEEAVYRVINEMAAGQPNGTIFHFTTLRGAYNIMKSDEMFLSPTTPRGADLSVSDNSYGYLSFTRDGNIQTSQYPLQINSIPNNKDGKLMVRFAVDKKALKTNDFELKQVNFTKQKVESIVRDVRNGQTTSQSFAKKINYFKRLGFTKNPTDKNFIEDLYKFANGLDTKETRLLSNKFKLKNFSNFVNVVDFLINPHFEPNYTMQDIAYYFGRLTKWTDKIRLFDNVYDFDKGVGFKTLTDVMSGNENYSLTESEKQFLEKNDKNFVSPDGLEHIARVIYYINYNNEGLKSITSRATEMMNKFGLNKQITITNKKETRVSNLIDEVVAIFGQISNAEYSPNRLFVGSQNSFYQIYHQNALKSCKYIKIAIAEMYSDWLKQYTESITKKMKSIYSQLKSIHTINELVKFAYDNIYVFENICEKYIKDKSNILASYLNSLYEGKRGRKPATKPDLLSIINELLTKINFNEIKKEFIDTYKNNFYHYDEILYFKRSVMMFKNNMITKARREIAYGTKQRVGDLAVLYNNAGKANKENNL